MLISVSHLGNRIYIWGAIINSEVCTGKCVVREDYHVDWSSHSQYGRCHDDLIDQKIIDAVIEFEKKEDWSDTHYLVVEEMVSFKEMPDKMKAIYKEEGTGGLWDLAKNVTDSFHKKYGHVKWDGDYIDTIEKHLEENL